MNRKVGCNIDHNTNKKPSIFVLSPNADTIFSHDNISKINNIGDLTIIKTSQPIHEIEALFQETQPRILALDPSFTDWKFPTDTILKIPNLKAICLQTSSYSWIDLPKITSENIPVICTQGFPTNAVAEYAITIAMNVARKIPLLIKNHGKQDLSKLQGIEVAGRTAGIIGLGRIGKRIAEICNGLGMNVQYWSQNSRDERFEFTPLKKLFATSDLIFPALSKNSQTMDLITDSLLLSIKTSSILTTISPLTHIYNHDLVLELVKQKKIYGYAFEEGLIQEIEDYRGNVFASPILAWTTKESKKRNGNLWTKNIIDTVQGKFTNKVN